MTRMAGPRFVLVRSRLEGNPEHHEELRRLLEAPEAYWVAQTPVGFRPVTGFAVDPTGEAYAELALDARVAPDHLQTLLVVMAARMPGLSIEFAVSGDPAGWAGLRLVRGKLEGRREDEGPAASWKSLPHHSTWIGRK
jgi:hypothetical protein